MSRVSAAVACPKKDCTDFTEHPAEINIAAAGAASACVPELESLRPREQRMVWRFTQDVHRLCRSLARVTRPGGHLVFVADSQLRGVPVQNSQLCQIAAESHGFTFRESVLRDLPSQHRYLPPPKEATSTLRPRMHEELILTFERVAQ